MKKIALLLIISMGFVACTSEQKCARLYPPQIITKTIIEYKDSLITVYIHDTTFILADTVYDTTKVYINNGIIWSNKVYGETKLAKGWAQVVNSKLLLELTQKDSAITKLLKENVIVETKLVTEYQTEIKKVYVTKWYDQISRVISIIVILLFIIITVIKIVKSYVKPF
jgi:uncharacterized protein YcfL